MTYLNPTEMTDENRALFLLWLVDEDLPANDIVNNGRFAVKNGRITGHKFVRGADGERLEYNGQFVTVPFIWPQKNPLPEWSV